MANSEVGGRINTRVDELIALVTSRSQISAPDAASELGVAQEMVESWARFLEKTGDLKIVYKGLTPTFVAPEVSSSDEQAPSEPSEERPVSTRWHALSENIASHLNTISDAIKQKAYEKIKPTLKALEEQLAQIRERLRSASIEEQEREALEESIEHITERIGSVEKNATSNKSIRLKRETKHLSKDIESLTTKLSSLKDTDTNDQTKATDEDDPLEGLDENAPFEEKVKELESRAREAVESGDLKRAEFLFAKIRELYEEVLPKQYEQMRSTLKDRIYSLKKDITFASDDFEKRTLTATLDHIEAQLEEYEKCIEREEWDSLETIENDIVSSYNNLPVGLEKEKQRIESTFGSLIVTAAQARRTRLNEQLAAISKQIDTHRDELDACLERDDFKGAYAAYGAIRSSFENVPPQLVIERIDLQVAMLDDFKRLSTIFKERFIAKNENHIETCTHLIESVKEHLRGSRFEEAQRSYDQALEELSSIDHNYFEQRSRIQYDLMRAHKELLDRIASGSDQTFENLVRDFQKKLQDGRAHLTQGEPDLAERVYLELLEMYRTLPRGYEERKRSLREQIFDYYKDLTTDQSEPVPVSLDDILERLVSIHHSLNSGDPTVLTTDLKRIEQLIEPLPARVRERNPMLDRELSRLTSLRGIYERIIEESQRLDREGEAFENLDEVRSFIEESERWLERENVSAAVIVMMLRTLDKRIEPLVKAREAPKKTVPKKPDSPRETASSEEPVSDLRTRIDSIKSLLEE